MTFLIKYWISNMFIISNFQLFNFSTFSRFQLSTVQLFNILNISTLRSPNLSGIPPAGKLEALELLGWGVADRRWPCAVGLMMLGLRAPGFGACWPRLALGTATSEASGPAALGSSSAVTIDKDFCE